MKAIIQHTFTSGLGETIKMIYDYIIMSKALRDFGYTNIKLIISIRSLYFHNEIKFFDFFNEKTFNIFFDDIEFIIYPITTETYEDYICVLKQAGTPGVHQWDLFIQDTHPYNPKIEESFYANIPKKINYLKPTELFNDKIIDLYQKIKEENNLNSKYVCIYFRSADSVSDNSWFSQMEEEIRKVINEHDKIFICSNYYDFKQNVKEINNTKTVILDIPSNEIFGDPSTNLYLSSLEKKYNLFSYAIIETLLIGESDELFHFSTYRRFSNFAICANINNVKINMLYI
jgi:hypothetical protein